MSQVFELFLTKDQITAEDFEGLYTSLSSYLGSLKNLRFHILLKDKRVRYLIESENDLSAISSSLAFCTLRPANPEEVALPTHVGNERFVNFISGGSLLDLQEKIAVKRGKTLDHFVCDVKRVMGKTTITTLRLYFRNAAGQYTLSKKTTYHFPSHLFAFDFSTANNFMKSENPKYLNIEKVLHMIAPENINALLEVNTYPYFPKPYYLPLPSYEFDKHSLIVGASGSGKSKFIQLYVDRLNRLTNKYNYRVIVIDPHANLANDLRGIENSKVIDFNGETTELFAGAEADVTAATELTTTLFKSLMGESFNPRVERVLRFSLFVLFTSQSMTLGMLKRFLTELELRQQVLDHVQGHVPQNISHFFATDFNEIRTAFYNEGLLPIISLVDELELQPALLSENEVSLQQTIQSNFLTVFSLNKVSMGEKVVKTVAGLLIQQIFLLAQSRAFNERVMLIIDEISVVQSPALAAILSEARKFNLFVILTQQYLSQVDKDLRDAIFGNVSNYYCFRVSEEDATHLVGNLPMEIPKEMVMEAKDKRMDEQQWKIKMLTDLSPRECIVRVASNGLLLPCFKGRTLDISSDSIVVTVAQDFQPQAYTPPPVLTKFEEKAASETMNELPSLAPSPAPTSPPAEFTPINNAAPLQEINSAPTPAPVAEHAPAPITPEPLNVQVTLPPIEPVKLQELPIFEPLQVANAEPQPFTEVFVQLHPAQTAQQPIEASINLQPEPSPPATPVSSQSVQPEQPPPGITQGAAAPPGPTPSLDDIMNQQSAKEGKGEQK